ncbi:MAG: hypothetical protein R3D51_17040 [Hyphomicrobiaceae bacterium]
MRKTNQGRIAMQWRLSMFLVILFGATTWFYFFTQDQKSKREWSVVQGAIFRAGKVPTQNRIEYQYDNGCNPCIGILTLDGKDRMWILARSNYGERLKIMGGKLLGETDEYRVRISRAEFESIKEKGDLSDEVEQFFINSIDPRIR